ncbi:hypothetical protein Ais01nite_65380 [Asanoa ishikariensis]|nr:hypothetical protein Ais01nite_65380 [Asanoa ishikariensis]
MLSYGRGAAKWVRPATPSNRANANASRSLGAMPEYHLTDTRETRRTEQEPWAGCIDATISMNLPWQDTTAKATAPAAAEVRPA